MWLEGMESVTALAGRHGGWVCSILPSGRGCPNDASLARPVATHVSGVARSADVMHRVSGSETGRSGGSC